MFELYKINNLYNCKICQNVLEESVSLPCGGTICQVLFLENLMNIK